MNRLSLLCVFLLSGHLASVLAADCGTQVPGSEVFFQPGTLILIGEIHGTRETPRAVGDLACRAAGMGIPVRIGLEIPVKEQVLMQGWFRSADQQQVLWNSPFFSKSYQDGRSSRAMGQLLLRMRAIANAGMDLEVFLFDPVTMANRDRGMAERVAAILAGNPAAVVFVLSGNLHAQKTTGTPFNKAFVPLGHFLAEEGLSPTSIKILNTKGTAWMCNGSTSDTCGIRKIGGKNIGDPPLLELGGEHTQKGYDGYLFIGPVTASEPFLTAEGPG